MLYLSAEFHVHMFIPSKVPVKFKKKFQDPIRPLVQISDNPGERVKYFCMLCLSSKFQVYRFIHPKVLTMFRKNSFRDPIRPLVQILENPGALVKYF